MYDYERLQADILSARKSDPNGLCPTNVLKWQAKLSQLSELANTVADEKVGFILSELIDMVGE